MQNIQKVERQSFFYPSEFLVGLGAGDVAVDGTRTFGGRLFEIGRHIDRLLDAASYQYISTDLSKSDIEETITSALRTYRERMPSHASPSAELEVRFVLAAEGTSPNERSSRLLVYVQSFETTLQCLSPKYRFGCPLISVQQRAIPASVVCPQIKSRGSSHWRRAELEADAESAGAWALLSFENGVISEGVGIGASGWNIHIVKNGVIYTPTLTQAVNGVTKQLVKRLANDNDIHFIEKSLYIDDIQNADEVFLTSTTIGILPVQSLDGKEINSNAVWGTVTARIASLFNEQYHFPEFRNSLI